MERPLRLPTAVHLNYATDAASYQPIKSLTTIKCQPARRQSTMTRLVTPRRVLLGALICLWTCLVAYLTYSAHPAHHVLDGSNSGPQHAATQQLSIASSIQPTSHSIALFFLTRQIATPLLLFLLQLDRCQLYDIFIVVDDNSGPVYDIDALSSLGYHSMSDTHRIAIIQYNDTELMAAGYSGLNYGRGKPSAWDKAWYANTADERYAFKYDHVYWIEEDVFIPSVHALHALTSNVQQQPHADFISRDHTPYSEIPSWGWWQQAANTSVLQTFMASNSAYRTMICAMGMSRRYLQALHHFHTRVHSLQNMVNEIVFPSIAAHYKLTHYAAPQLRNTIHYQYAKQQDRQWHVEDMLQRSDFGDHLYHPIKNSSLHMEYRYRLWQHKPYAVNCPA